jgi:hypothetical protein
LLRPARSADHIDCSQDRGPVFGVHNTNKI